MITAKEAARLQTTARPERTRRVLEKVDYQISKMASECKNEAHFEFDEDENDKVLCDVIASLKSRGFSLLVTERNSNISDVTIIW
jgi:hypothetical protein